MAGAEHPSKTRFVLRRVESEAAQAEQPAIEGVGSVEPLEEGSELSVVEVEEHPEGPKAAWKRLKAALPHHEVNPVLVDDEGGEHYPTGQLTVRFHEVPSDEELKAFAEEHGLELKSRNKWVAMQADFECREKESYLPELVHKLEEKGVVRAAWPSTLSRYRRH